MISSLEPNFGYPAALTGGQIFTAGADAAAAVRLVPAALLGPRLPAEAAAALAEAEGFCCHLTSLVLVDEAGEVAKRLWSRRGSLTPFGAGSERTTWELPPRGKPMITRRTLFASGLTLPISRPGPSASHWDAGAAALATGASAFTNDERAMAWTADSAFCHDLAVPVLGITGCVVTAGNGAKEALRLRDARAGAATSVG